MFRQIIRAGAEDCWADCLVFLDVEIELEGGGGGEDEVEGPSGTCAPLPSSLAAAFFFFAMVGKQQLIPAASCNDNKERAGVKLRVGCCVAQT